MIVHGMFGLGDNIYQRAFIKQIKETVYLRTPWAEIYQDLPHVRCTRPNTTLRTQLKNVQSQKTWHPEPIGRATSISYGQDGIIRGMARSFGFDCGDLDLPDYGTIVSDAPYVVVRPVTLRREWYAESRNPKPEYIAEAAQIARAAGFKVVSIADLEQDKEWAVEPLPEADVQYHHGELHVTQLLALIKNATVVIGGIGWLLPAALAYKTPAWIVAGGYGGYNAPKLITDKRFDMSNLNFALPDRFCLCTNHHHKCDKHITNHADKFTKWLRRYADLVS